MALQTALWFFFLLLCVTLFICEVCVCVCVLPLWKRDQAYSLSLQSELTTVKLLQGFTNE